MHSAKTEEKERLKEDRDPVCSKHPHPGLIDTMAFSGKPGTCQCVVTC